MRSLLAIALVASLATPVAAAPTRPYVDHNLGYRLEVPSSWKVTPGWIMAATSPLDGPGDTYQEAVKVVAADLQPGLTLEKYVDQSLGTWKNIWTSRERKRIALGGETAFRLVIDQHLGAIRTRVLKTFVAHQGKVFVITCSAEPGRFQAYLPRFSGITQSFRFVAKKPAKR